MTDNLKTPPNVDEEAWLQSGVEALKNAEEDGYAYTAEEMNAEIKQLKETLRNK